MRRELAKVFYRLEIMWCRRGESEFGPPLIPRNLLILQDDRNYKNIEFTQVRYTAGTREAGWYNNEEDSTSSWTYSQMLSSQYGSA